MEQVTHITQFDSQLIIDSIDQQHSEAYSINLQDNQGHIYPLPHDFQFLFNHQDGTQQVVSTKNLVKIMSLLSK